MPKGFSKGETDRIIAIYLFTFVFCIYFLSISNTFDIEQHGQRFQVAKSIVEKGDLSVPESTISIRGLDGRSYSLYGLGWSILAVPFYMGGKFFGRNPENLILLLNPLVGAATVTLVFLFSIALGYSSRSSLVVAIFYGLGTFAWPMAKHPFDHIVETFFVLLSVYFMYLHTSKNAIIHIILSALCIGFAINTRLVSILVLPALLVLMGTGRGVSWRSVDKNKIFFRKIVIFMSVFLPFAGLVLFYNYYRFGSIFETGFQLLAVKTGLDFFSGTPFLTGFSGFLMSPGKGFFYYSPIAILFFFTVVPFYKKHRCTAIAFILLILSYLLFLSRNIYWHGDWAWGPRYLLAITPYVILPITDLLDSFRWRKNYPFMKLSVYVVFTLSLLIQISAVSVHYHNYFINLQKDQSVQFTVVHAEGVPFIDEPYPKIYFTWMKSPIVSQIKEIKRIGNEIKNYRFVELPQNATDLEKINKLSSMNLFDFWWIYMFYVDRSYKGFIVLLVLIIVVVVCGYRMLKFSRRDTLQLEVS
jgi:4-amino-4-deoxy-L-arabinose transferase-like glycosyltransferase